MPRGADEALDLLVVATLVHEDHSVLPFVHRVFSFSRQPLATGRSLAMAIASATASKKAAMPVIRSCEKVVPTKLASGLV